MRAIICLFLLFSFIGKVYGQVPSQKEMQAQMKLVIDELNNQIIELEKQIADAKKKKEDPETIKEMEDQLEMLRKQIEMMGGVTKGLKKVSDKTIKEVAKQDSIKNQEPSLPTADKKKDQHDAEGYTH